MSNPYYTDQQTAAQYPNLTDHQLNTNQGYPPNHYNQQPPPPVAHVHIADNRQKQPAKKMAPTNTTGFQTNAVMINGKPLRIDIGANYPIDVRRCPKCGVETETYVRYKYGKLIWLSCLVLFCVSVCLFWVPFCIDDWKDKHYHCARCQTLKGFKKGQLC